MQLKQKMPPKGNQPSAKTIQKEKQKIIEDRTFGLKNKNKSKKVQEYIQQVTKNIQNARYPGQTQNRQQQSTAELNAKRKEEEKKAQMLAMLRSSLRQPPIPEGANPKDFPCIFFLHNCCDKGDKCRYSHNNDTSHREAPSKKEPVEEASAEAKAASGDEEKISALSQALGKLDLYRDMREQLMEYNARQQANKSGKNYESILQEYKERYQTRFGDRKVSKETCPNYLAACKKREIGWGFKCPQEEKTGYCEFRHCLPPGYVIEEKKKVEVIDKDLDYVEIEEDIERRRNEITSGTPVNPTTFAEWKKKRLEAKKAIEQENITRVENILKQRGGEHYQGLTGRAIFENIERISGMEDVAAEQNKEEIDEWLKNREDIEEVEKEAEQSAGQPLDTE